MVATEPQPEAGFLSSQLLTEAGFRHAFFTRVGGASQGAYASLNFSSAVGDDAGTVAENFQRAARALGVNAAELYFVSQVHGCSVQRVDGSEPVQTFCEREGDVVASAASQVACAVRTADCVPLLLADRRTGRVAAVHAGWRGVARGAVAAGVAALTSGGARTQDLVAAIGPHISGRAFEVSEEVAAELLRASPDPNVVDRSRTRPHVDLRRIVRSMLQALRLRPKAIDDVPGCTVADEALFFSFRRDGAKSGRHLSAIVSNG